MVKSKPLQKEVRKCRFKMTEKKKIGVQVPEGTCSFRVRGRKRGGGSSFNRRCPGLNSKHKVHEKGRGDRKWWKRKGEK